MINLMIVFVFVKNIINQGSSHIITINWMFVNMISMLNNGMRGNNVYY